MNSHEKASFFLDGADENIHFPNGYMLAIENTMAQYDCKWTLEPYGVLETGEVLFRARVQDGNDYPESFVYWGESKSTNIEIAVEETLAQLYDYLSSKGRIK